MADLTGRVVRLHFWTAPVMMLSCLFSVPLACGQVTIPQPAPPPTQPTPFANLPAPPIVVEGPGAVSTLRFQFTIDPAIPMKDLLPRPPETAARRPVLLGDDLSDVPRIDLEAKPPVLHPKESRIPEPRVPQSDAQDVPTDADSPEKKALEPIALRIARINHINKQGRDRFIHALLDERADLRGLPFLLGDECRTKGEHSRAFTRAVELARTSEKRGSNKEIRGGIWFLAETLESDYKSPVPSDFVSRARIAAAMQIMAPLSARDHLGLVKYLESVSHVDSTHALARLALYAPDDGVRATSVKALRVRREKDYTDILMAGFRYPWLPVQRRAAEALIKLDRKDLVEELVAILDEPDPRAPFTKESDGKPVTAVRELVRINHHRNCLLCHAPVEADKVSGEMLTAPVAAPGLPLPSPNEGYGSDPSPDVLVRIDVTYLRQDFSLMQPVEDAHPWPEMQRFDFLVRTRELSDDEAEEYRKLLKPEPGVLPPNHRAALLALREMTGKDAAPTAEAWRKLLATADRQGSARK